MGIENSLHEFGEECPQAQIGRVPGHVASSGRGRRGPALEESAKPPEPRRGPPSGAEGLLLRARRPAGPGPGPAPAASSAEEKEVRRGADGQPRRGLRWRNPHAEEPAMSDRQASGSVLSGHGRSQPGGHPLPPGWPWPSPVRRGRSGSLDAGGGGVPSSFG
ncbi:homeobox protein cut-like 1 [Ornithorhynchus anatinus]|uniref:homeobox protein cut-like 1 n=1 Tax=Ornithorhynchus anatinus TaxID=9258 RepID=UPI0010A9276C|nr:homeobox protein cut-like 1 [Ornithorhynchus anatinus]